MRLVLQDEQLGGWRLKRTIDGVDKAEFRLDQNYVLRAGAKAKVLTHSMIYINCSHEVKIILFRSYCVCLYV